MFATRQFDHQAPPTGDATYSRVYGHTRPCVSEASPGIVDQCSTNERFTREAESVREFLIRNAARLTRQRADAEDLVQETLLKAYISFDSYREGTHLKSWLSRIMSNAWIDRHRSSQRHPVEQLCDEVSETQLAVDAFDGSSRSQVDSAESQVLQSLPSAAELALRELPDDVRAVVYYACIADYRNTEIAALLKIPVGTVGSRLHRGKALLRDSLADWAPTAHR